MEGAATDLDNALQEIGMLSAPAGIVDDRHQRKAQVVPPKPARQQTNQQIFNPYSTTRYCIKYYFTLYIFFYQLASLLIYTAMCNHIHIKTTKTQGKAQEAQTQHPATTNTKEPKCIR